MINNNLSFFRVIIQGFWGTDLALTFPAPVGVQKNPRFLRKFQICGLITLLLDIGSLARGAKIPFTSPDFDQKMAKKKGVFGGFWGGSRWGGPKGGGRGVGVYPGDPPFCGSNPYRKPRFSPKGPFSGIFAIFGHFGPFWPFLGVFGGFWGFWAGYPKVAKSGQKGGFLGGSKKGVKIRFSEDSPIKFRFFFETQKVSFFESF